MLVEAGLMASVCPAKMPRRSSKATALTHVLARGTCIVTNLGFVLFGFFCDEGGGVVEVGARFRRYELEPDSSVVQVLYELYFGLVFDSCVVLERVLLVDLESNTQVGDDKCARFHTRRPFLFFFFGLELLYYYDFTRLILV